MSDSLYEEGLTPAVSEGALSAGGTALTPEETDTLGEVGNICMGAVATTMYTLMDRRVEITTPRVSVHTTREVLAMYTIPFVIINVEYTEGITGDNLLLLKEYDAAVITDVLMGGEGVIEEPIEFNELHMSAMNEIMNQMIGSSATALSEVIGCMVNISPPISQLKTLESEEDGMLAKDEIVIVIIFDMEIEGLLKSQLIQLMPYDQGREISAKLVKANAEKAKKAAEAAAAEAAAKAAAQTAPEPAAAAVTLEDILGAPEPQTQSPPAQTGGPAPEIRPVQYESFGSDREYDYSGSGLSMVYDIPLHVSVELGKTNKEISEILDFDFGTVIMLEKTAGDPVEILVNGKLVATGEVVVIDENYGVRITELYN
ncbi:MAG: flagellar motor switch phosphatase FliY [Oscillospiraceae bacterium]|nr:flagellar motor switch phosphatase FliY [Oscillospiraceae bacterium]